MPQKKNKKTEQTASIGYFAFQFSSDSQSLINAQIFLRQVHASIQNQIRCKIHMNIWTNLIPKAKQFSWMPRHEEEKLVQKKKKRFWSGKAVCSAKFYVWQRNLKFCICGIPLRGYPQAELSIGHRGGKSWKKNGDR